MGIKDLKVYSKANQSVRNQFEDGDLIELDPSEWDKAFSCLPLEKKSKSPLCFLGFEWETGLKDPLVTQTGEKNGWGDPVYKINPSFIDKVLKRALSTPVANYLNYRQEGSKYLELVSVPATLGYHKKTLLKQFFAQKLHNRFKQDEGCGLHVHIDNKCLDETIVLNMVWFLSNLDNRDFLERVAGRDLWATDWCKPYAVVPNENLTSIGVTVERTSDNEFFITGDQFKYIGTKSICLNASTGFGTCELRIFSSPQTYTALARRLEFTEALVKFCKDKKLAEITVTNFKDFLKTKRRRYSHLCKFMKIK